DVPALGRDAACPDRPARAGRTTSALGRERPPLLPAVAGERHRRGQRQAQRDSLMGISTGTVAAPPRVQAGSCLKILIADDESLARTTLRSILHQWQMPLETLEDAPNGEEMVELVRRHTPDIVFVDIRMPKLDGLEAIKRAKALAPDAQWLILTGFSEFTYAQEALRIGVSDYLLKPVDPSEVRRVVARVIEERKRRLLHVNQQFERDLAALYHGLIALE